ADGARPHVERRGRRGRADDRGGAPRGVRARVRGGGAMNLLLFLSDRCNMSCDYCFLDLNRPGATVLDAAAAKKAMREHWERAPGGPAQITFLGGEPLVHWELL